MQRSGSERVNIKRRSDARKGKDHPKRFNPFRMSIIVTAVFLLIIMYRILNATKKTER